MDKAIILGVYNFVGFHMCHTLLNKGIEVNGIHIEMDDEPFLEDKRFEIGRNANFKEKTITQWNTDENEEKVKSESLIISIYDFFMLKEEAVLQRNSVTDALMQYLERNKSNRNVVIIVPVQMLSKNMPEFDMFLEQARGEINNVQIIYLPALFGPWQPSAFMFQQAIISSRQKTDISLSEREWTGDALFVRDAAETIYEIIEEGKPDSYLLESGQNDYWEQCAAYFGVDLINANSRESIQIDSHINRVQVRTMTPISEAFLKQQEHVKLYYHK